MALAGKHALAILERIGNANAKGEYYLTDAVAIARDMGLKAVAIETGEDDMRGINTKAQLAETEAVLQKRLRAAALDAGVTMIAPETVFLCADTKFGKDVTIEPNVVFGPGVTVADGALIRSFSHLEGAHVGKGARVGPFARLRPGADLGADVHIGNFVEVKAAKIEAGAKANHLAYIGDARVGAGANVGAGTITCNYDGVAKHRTDIGKGAFIGSNSSLVAPVKIGDGAYVGSGSVITKDVPADALAVARAEQTVKEGWAKRLRQLKALGKKPAKAPPEKSALGRRYKRKSLSHGEMRFDFQTGLVAAAKPAIKLRGPSKRMCGIVGILGREPVAGHLVDALKRLEYRGYDSAGIATLDHGVLARRRAEGKLQALETRLGTRAARRQYRHRPHPLGDPRQADREATRIRTPPTASRSCTTASSRISASCARS